MAQDVETPESFSVASGATDVFATGFTFEFASDVEVLVDDGGGYVTQEAGVAYLIPPADWLSDGGDCVFQTGFRPASGSKVWRRRVTRLAQGESFGDDTKFSPARSELAYDRLTRIAQEQRVALDRAIKVDPGQTPLTPAELRLLAGGLEGIIETAAEAGQDAGAAAGAAAANDRAFRDLNNAIYQRAVAGALQVGVRAILDAYPPTPNEWGAVPGTGTITAAITIGNGSTNLSVPGANFTSDMAGMLISVPKAKAGGLTLLTTVVARNSSTSLTLAAPATAAVTAQTTKVSWAEEESAKLQAMLDATLPALAPCRIDKVYHIAQPVFIPERRTLQGTNPVGQILDYSPYISKNSLIVIWPGGKTVPLNGCKYDRLTFGGADAMINPPTPGFGATETNDAIARIAAWTDIAIEGDAVDQRGLGVRDGGFDVQVYDCSFIGLERAGRLNNLARWRLKNIKIDCLNGFELANTYDTGQLDDYHVWGFWNGNYGHGAFNPLADTRPGKGLWLHSGIDGCVFSNALIFGMTRNLVLQGEQLVPGPRPGVYACKFTNFWLDTVLAAQATRLGVGLETIGECRLNSFVNLHSDASNVNVRLNHTTGMVGLMLFATTIGVARSNQIQIFGGSGIINGLQLGGGAQLITAETGQLVRFGPSHGEWLIDNVLAEDCAGSILFDQPNPVMRRLISIGKNIRTRNAPLFFRRNWMSFCRVGKAANQVLAAGVDTPINWDAVYEDSWGEFDATVDVYNAVRPGLKRLVMAIDYAAASASPGQFSVYLKDESGTIIHTLFSQFTTDTGRRVFPIAWDHYVGVANGILSLIANSTVGGTIYGQVTNTQTKFTITDADGQ